MEWVNDANGQENNGIVVCSTCPNNVCKKVFCPIEFGGSSCTKRSCIIYASNG